MTAVKDAASRLDASCRGRSRVLGASDRPSQPPLERANRRGLGLPQGSTIGGNPDTFRQHWVVYLKRPFGGPEYVLQYLPRYTHRVAISKHRLVSFADGQVTFRWRDSAHHNEQKLTSLSHDKFLRRFLLHLLPQGFVRIRHFGFLACRKRATTLPLCFQLLGAREEPPAEKHAPSSEDAPDLHRCPKCGGPMKVIERLTAAEILFRSPPRMQPAA